MKTKIKALIVGGLIIGFFGLVTTVVAISSRNSEVSLREHVKAQQSVCEAYFDKMWKILQSDAKVADQYRDAFKEIYPQLIAGRYSNEGSGTLMKWIQESNPSFDASMYKNLMASIDAERTGFFMEQKKLIDLDREHKVLRQQFPASIFIGSRPDVEFTIITSTKTEAVYKTGKEDINLFDKR